MFKSQDANQIFEPSILLCDYLDTSLLTDFMFIRNFSFLQPCHHTQLLCSALFPNDKIGAHSSNALEYSFKKHPYRHFLDFIKTGVTVSIISTLIYTQIEQIISCYYQV